MIPEFKNVRTARNFKHGHAQVGKVTREYKIWSNMKQRVLNQNNSDYKLWGGRGIQICDRWLNSFEDFLSDMGPCPPGLTIDRWPNPNGNYEPGNCRWATIQEQGNNRRTNHLLTLNGRTQTIAQWSRELGLKKVTLWRCTNLGWTDERVLTESVEKHTS